MTMLLRNRLIALIIRIAIFIAFCVSVGPFIAQYENTFIALSTPSVQLGLNITITFAFVIVFNLIDLRHGVLGVAAGPYMPIALPLFGFSILAGILYFNNLLPNGNAPGGTYAIILNAMLIVGPLVEWLFLDEKGTVPLVSSFSAMLYPILFFVFGYFRTVIWNEATIYNGLMYSIPFLDFTSPSIVGYATIFFIVTLGTNMLLTFINNLLAGRFGLWSEVRD